jgi:excisionase family DNA binding protein
MDWLTARQVAAALGVARSTLYGLMAKHDLPKPVSIGGKRLWVASEVRAWIDARSQARNVVG